MPCDFASAKAWRAWDGLKTAEPLVRFSAVALGDRFVMHGTIGIFQSLDCRRRPCVCRIFGGPSACSTARQQKVGSPPGGGITLGNCFSNAPVRCRMVLRLNPTELRSYAIAALIVTATIIERLHEEHAQVTVRRSPAPCGRRPPAADSCLGCSRREARCARLPGRRKPKRTRLGKYRERKPLGDWMRRIVGHATLSRSVRK